MLLVFIILSENKSSSKTLVDQLHFYFNCCMSQSKQLCLI